MSKPTLSLSLQEIQREAAEEIRWLNDLAAKRPSWDWPRELLVFAHEFHALAATSPLDSGRTADFTVRLAAHIRKKRLKGVEPTLWRAEALESLAREKKNA